MASAGFLLLLLVQAMAAAALGRAVGPGASGRDRAAPVHRLPGRRGHRRRRLPGRALVAARPPHGTLRRHRGRHQAASPPAKRGPGCCGTRATSTWPPSSRSPRSGRRSPSATPSSTATTTSRSSSIPTGTPTTTSSTRSTPSAPSGTCCWCGPTATEGRRCTPGTCPVCAPGSGSTARSTTPGTWTRAGRWRSPFPGRGCGARAAPPCPRRTATSGASTSRACSGRSRPPRTAGDT